MKSLAKSVLMLSIVHAALAATVDLTKVAFEEKLGAPLPKDTLLTDENGASRSLGAYLEAKPAVLFFYYSTCPNLCDLVINGLIKSLRQVPESLGRDFTLLALSIDPHETNKALQAKKALFMKRYDRGDIQAAHFLRGPDLVVKNIADAAGFHYLYDPVQKQFAHPSGILVINSKGQIFQYFFGIAYEPKTLSTALLAARGEGKGSLAQKLLLFCYHYDPRNGSWGPLIMNTLRGFALLFLLAGVVTFIFLQRKRKKYV